MWYYIVRHESDTDGWIALAKRGPFVADGDAIREPGDVWFEFGDTAGDARSKIEAEVRSMSIKGA